jgi:hypothetical protein
MKTMKNKNQPAVAPPPCPPVMSRAARLLTGYLAAAVVLAAFWVLQVASVADKSTTYDEIAHVTAGYAYWTLGDFRMNPENGNLPQRVMALPLLAGSWRYPSVNQPLWQTSHEWLFGHEFFYKLGNDLWTLLLLGRAASASFAVALGLLVYMWSRRLFGQVGGMLSLMLFVLCPTVLANGPLMTSDMAGALFFFASTWAIWAMCHRISTRTVLLSVAAMAGLFLSKMSAAVIVPIGLLLIVVRLIRGLPLPIRLPGVSRELLGRPAQAAALLGAVTLHAVAIPLLVWTFYGWRYDMMAPVGPQPAQPAMSWDAALKKVPASRDGRQPMWSRAIEAARDARVLPEAYLYGHAFVLAHSENRPSYLAGQFGLSGWWWFFPYTFAVKTPLTIMAAMLLAVAAVVWRWRAIATSPLWRRIGAGLYDTAPLWILMAGFWATVLASKLNIGHRHLLPAYAPMLVLCGAGAYWLLSSRRVARALPAILVGLLAIETAWVFPNYLAYFNLTVGGSKQGYKHLVDSSLDWGQDLPALRDYLQGRGLGGPDKPVYYAYFGTGSPEYYGIRGVSIGGSPAWDHQQRVMTGQFPRLGPGTYCISASILAPVLLDAMGEWCPRYEQLYQATGQALSQYQSANGPASLDRAWASDIRVLPPVRQMASQLMWAPSPQEFFRLITERANSDIRVVLAAHDSLRLARLMAYLRQTPPAHNINGSILVFELSEKELSQALLGPPPQFGTDVLGLVPRK